MILALVVAALTLAPARTVPPRSATPQPAVVRPVRDLDDEPLPIYVAPSSQPPMIPLPAVSKEPNRWLPSSGRDDQDDDPEEESVMVKTTTLPKIPHHR